jgi:3-phenylpropionate/trans-cinnamate dioxygenase ferredoxin subunit
MWIDVKKVEDFPNNSREIIDLDYTTVIVFNIDDKFYAIDHLCTHQDFSLADADCANGVITCPFHGAKFCVKTGAVMAPPAFEDLQTFEVRVFDGMVQVKA